MRAIVVNALRASGIPEPETKYEQLIADRELQLRTLMVQHHGTPDFGAKL